MSENNLLKDPDFLEYLEEHQVSEEETPIAFAEWLKENDEEGIDEAVAKEPAAL